MSPRPPTPSQTVGPFFGFALPFQDDSQAARPEGEGSIRIEGQLFDGDGQPVPDGLLELWARDQFGRCRTDGEGAFHFVATRPVSAGHGQAPHFTLNVFARGLLRHLVTRIYLPDQAEANQEDPVLRQVEAERRSTLVAASEGAVLRFDVHLQGDRETVFFAL